MKNSKSYKVVRLAAIFSSVVAAGVVIRDYGVWETIARLSLYLVFYSGCIWWLLRNRKTKVA